ncbi:MAG: hypothetical protein MI919_25510, partial [Holophagales bacterium]|nr:hypothetical protein [Holophagales bacterium]
MFGDRPGRRQIDLGLGGPVPRDLLVLMGVLFLTFSLSAFPQSTGRLMEILRLGPDLWQQGFLWQLVTYPFVARYGSGLWLLVALWMVYMFGRSVFFFVGRRHFWRHFFLATLTGGVVAVVAQVLVGLAGAASPL